MEGSPFPSRGTNKAECKEIAPHNKVLLKTRIHVLG